MARRLAGHTVLLIGHHVDAIKDGRLGDCTLYVILAAFRRKIGSGNRQPCSDRSTPAGVAASDRPDGGRVQPDLPAAWQ